MESIQRKRKQLKWGFINLKGDWVIEPQFDIVSNFKNDVAMAGTGKWNVSGSLTNKKLGLINPKGEWILEPSLQKIDIFDDVIVAMLDFYKVGLMDYNGNWIVEPTLRTIRNFLNGTAIAERGTQKGVIDSKGKWIIEPGVYKVLKEISDSLLCVSKDNDIYELMDRNGNSITDKKYNYIGEFSEQLAPAMSDGKWGYIDMLGNWEIQPQYDNALPFGEGLAGVKTDGKWGYIDRNANWVISPRFEKQVDRFSEGFASIDIGDFKPSYQFINKEGELLLKSKFTDVSYFRNGFSVVAKGKGYTCYTYLNSKGKVFKTKYYRAFDFYRGGLAEVMTDELNFGLIDSNDNIVVPSQTFYSLNTIEEWLWARFQYVTPDDEAEVSSRAKDLCIVLIDENWDYVYFRAPEWEDVKKFQVQNPTYNMMRFRRLPEIETPLKCEK